MEQVREQEQAFALSTLSFGPKFGKEQGKGAPKLCVTKVVYDPNFATKYGRFTPKCTYLASSQQQPIALGPRVIQALRDFDLQGPLGDRVGEEGVHVVDLAVFRAGGVVGGIAHLAELGYDGGEQGCLVEAEDYGAGGYGDVGEDLST